MCMRYQVDCDLWLLLFSSIQILLELFFRLRKFPVLLIIDDFLLSSIKVSNSLILIQRLFVFGNYFPFVRCKIIKRDRLQLIFRAWLRLVLLFWRDKRRDLWFILFMQGFFVVVVLGYLYWKWVFNVVSKLVLSTPNICICLIPLLGETTICQRSFHISNRLNLLKIDLVRIVILLHRRLACMRKLV